MGQLFEAARLQQLVGIAHAAKNGDGIGPGHAAPSSTVEQRTGWRPRGRPAAPVQGPAGAGVPEVWRSSPRRSGASGPPSRDVAFLSAPVRCLRTAVPEMWRSSPRPLTLFPCAVNEVCLQRLREVPWDALAGLSETVVPAMARVLEGAPAEREIDLLLRADRTLGKAQRAATVEAIFGVGLWRRRLAVHTASSEPTALLFGLLRDLAGVPEERAAALTALPPPFPPRFPPGATTPTRTPAPITSRSTTSPTSARARSE